MTIEEGARALLKVLRAGKPEDVYKREAACMLFAVGFMAGKIAGERRTQPQQGKDSNRFAHEAVGS